MKLICGPLDFDFQAATPAELEIVLYGHADRKKRGSVGASIRETVGRLKLEPAWRAWDLLSIALSVIAADTGVRRTKSPDGWTRDLDLQIAVADHAFWSSQTELVESALRFLTTDIWTITFLDHGIQPSPPKKRTLPDEDSAALLSGGLDSLVGAIDLTTRSKKRPYLVSQVAQGDKEKQAFFARTIGDGLSHLQLNHVAICPGKNERSQRSRSIVFLAYGVLVATTLKSYQEGKTVPLYVCENGFISINPPLTPGRLGSLSTRTTHPVFLGLFQRLLDAAGLSVRIENPYQFMTKGEMLAQCHDQEFLRKHASFTTSCGRYARNGFRHCGRCVPCLIRRSAFHKWKQPDETDYVYEDLSRNDRDHANFDDVRAAGMAVSTVETEGLDAWLGSSLSSTLIHSPVRYRETVGRGLQELGNFLRSAGVK